MKGRETVIAYFVWILLLVAALAVANQLYVASIFLTTEAIGTGNFYKLGWNIYTISGFARFFIFILGVCWLFWLGITEQLLIQARNTRIFWRRAGRLAGILVGLFLLATLTFFISG